ncbi:Uncharacterised protein [Vibrio cholerae]|nr:Uncharacterised protein [Vibrio cholerae]
MGITHFLEALLEFWATHFLLRFGAECKFRY